MYFYKLNLANICRMKINKHTIFCQKHILNFEINITCVNVVFNFINPLKGWREILGLIDKDKTFKNSIFFNLENSIFFLREERSGQALLSVYPLHG